MWRQAWDDGAGGWPPLCESVSAGERRDEHTSLPREATSYNGSKMATNKGHGTEPGREKNGMPGGSGGHGQHGTDQGKTDSAEE